MADSHLTDPPSPFVAAWIGRIAGHVPSPRRALDVAMGRGRHAMVMARAGLDVFGVDRRLDAVVDAVSLAAEAGVRVRGWCADLTAHPLPTAYFSVIVVARYLQRDLFPSLAAALEPGGVIVYETFTERQRAHGRGPTSPEHLLVPGELRQRFADLEVVEYKEVLAPDALARLVARRPV
jgi:SAM-dependent methyltransferase